MEHNNIMWGSCSRSGNKIEDLPDHPLPNKNLTYLYSANSAASYYSDEIFDFIDEINCGAVTCVTKQWDSVLKQCPDDTSDLQNENIDVSL